MTNKRPPEGGTPAPELRLQAVFASGSWRSPPSSPCSSPDAVPLLAALRKNGDADELSKIVKADGPRALRCVALMALIQAGDAYYRAKARLALDWWKSRR